MTERKKLKKQLSLLKHYRNSLPRLIDCSQVYGDNYYTEDDILIADKEIEELNQKLKELTA